MEAESIRSRCVELTVMSFMVAMTIATGVALGMILPIWGGSTAGKLTVLSISILFVVLSAASGVLCWMECRTRK